MFDRYTDKARKVIFFARYETSLSGYSAIDSEHILLGLIREDPFLINNGSIHVEEVRKLIAEKKPVRESLNSNVDVPLSTTAKKVLAYASEESDKLNHSQIGTEHLLLGLLRDEAIFACEILNSYGLTYSSVSEKIFNRPKGIQANEQTDEQTREQIRELVKEQAIEQNREIEQLFKLSAEMRLLAYQMIKKCDDVDKLCQQLLNKRNDHKS